MPFPLDGRSRSEAAGPLPKECTDAEIVDYQAFCQLVTSRRSLERHPITHPEYRIIRDRDSGRVYVLAEAAFEAAQSDG